MSDEFSLREYLQTTISDSVNEYFEPLRKHPVKFTVCAAVLAAGIYATDVRAYETYKPEPTITESIYL